MSSPPFGQPRGARSAKHRSSNHVGREVDEFATARAERRSTEVILIVGRKTAEGNGVACWSVGAPVKELRSRALRVSETLGANRTVVCLSLARLGDALGNSILFIVIPLYVAELPAPWFPLSQPMRAGLLLSLYGLAAACAQPFAGALSDRIGRRKPLIIWGLSLMALATGGFVLATRFTELLVLRLLQGLGLAMVVPASLALMALSSDKSSRGGSMGIYTTLRMVGFAAGPLIGGFLNERFGFSVTFLAGAAGIATAAALVQLWVDEPVQSTRREVSAGRSFKAIDVSLVGPGLVGLAAATFVMAVGVSLMVPLEKQFNQRLGEGALAFGAAFSALMISRLLLQMPLGYLSDRIGRKPLIVTGLLVMAPATALLGLVTSTEQLVGVRVWQGAASAAVAAPAFALAGDLATGKGVGRQMSLVTSSFMLGIAVGPLVAGALAAVSFWFPFVVGGALNVAGAGVVAWWVPETVRRGGE